MHARRALRHSLTRLLAVAITFAFGGTASAEPPGGVRFDKSTSACHFATLSHTDITGSSTTYTGFAEGSAIALSSPPGTMSCEVRVDGLTVDSTEPRHSSGILYTADQVTFTSSDWQTVEICAVIVWDVGQPSDPCVGSVYNGVPTDEISDAMHLTVTTFDGEYSKHPLDDNSAGHCHEAGVGPGTGCGAGFRTPSFDICTPDPSLFIFGWWSAAGQYRTFQLYAVGSGVFEGVSSPSEGPVIYTMRLYLGSTECGSVPDRQFIGTVNAV